MRSFLALMALAACLPGSAQPITQLKPLYPRTELIAGGQARCVIVCPEALRPLGDELAGALAKHGAKPEILRDSDLVSARWELDLPRVGKRHLIALGNISTNRLLAVLWGEGYVVENSLFPGPGGYVVRTVHDPFANGTNVVELAGSDEAGVRLAVQRFLTHHVPAAGDVVLPAPIVDVQFVPVEQRFFPAPPQPLDSKRQPQYSNMDYFRKLLRDGGFMDEQGRVIANPSADFAGLMGTLARIGETWQRTGQADLPPLMKQLLDANRALLSKAPLGPEREGVTAALAPMWDVLEELPVWTDEDRLGIANALLADARVGPEKRAVHELVKQGMVQVVDENHGTTSALRTHEAWRYFDKYYDLPDAEYWMNVARATFAGQCHSHQILEDASGYLCYCPYAAMRYAFAARDLRFFELGIARTYAEYIAQCSLNNLGLSTGFGDSPSLACPEFFEAIAPAAWFLRDPKLTWVSREMLPAACGLRVYQSNLPVDLTVQPQEPTDWIGMKRFPIFRQTLRKGEASKTFVTVPAESAGDEWFSKIVFRDGFRPDDQYLLLDGGGKFSHTDGYPDGPAGHMHEDVNTIVNFTARGRMWLVDHTYAERNIKDHSGLYLLRDGQVSYQVHEAKLKQFVAGPRYSLCQTVFEGFSGADWERTIIWHRGGSFIIVDRVVARTPGQYVARRSFRGLGGYDLKTDRLRLKQSGKACDLVFTPGATVDVAQEPFQNAEEWTLWYPHAPGVRTVLQEDQVADLQAGQALSFVGMLRAEDSEAALDAAPSWREELMAALKELAKAPALASVCADLTALATQQAPVATTRPADSGLTVATTKLPQALSGLRRADVNGDGQPQRLAYGAAGVTCLAADGRVLWQHDLPKPCRALDVGNLDDDPRLEVVAGCDDEKAYALDDDGHELWQFQCKPATASYAAPAVDWVRVADLEHDGQPEVVIGANYIHCLDRTGKLKWEKYLRYWRKMIVGDFQSGAIGDVNGDGKDEILALFNYTYAVALVLDAGGKVIVPTDYNEDKHYGMNIDRPHCGLLVDLFGSGRPQLLFGTDKYLYGFWGDGPHAGTSGVRRAGCHVALASWQPAEGFPWVFGATDMGAVIAYRCKAAPHNEWIGLDVQWSRVPGGRVTALAVATMGVRTIVLAGTKQGDVWAMDATSGEVVGRCRAAEAAVVSLVGEGTAVLAACEDGTVAKVMLP